MICTAENRSIVHRSLDEEWGGVFINSRVETITPQPTAPQRTGGSAPFPLAHTIETTLGVRPNFAWEPSWLLPALLAQFCCSRRTSSRKLELDAHCPRQENAGTGQVLQCRVFSRTHLCRRVLCAVSGGGNRPGTAHWGAAAARILIEILNPNRRFLVENCPHTWGICHQPAKIGRIDQPD
jgi:hypothetical protein